MLGDLLGDTFHPMRACIVSALLAAALAAPARAEDLRAGAASAPDGSLDGAQSAAELAPGAFLFLDIDGCRDCEGSFTVTDALGGHLEITTQTEAGFLELLRGDEPESELEQLSGHASPTFAISSFQGVTGPSYIVVRCPTGASAGCAPRWDLQVEQSEAGNVPNVVAIGQSKPACHLVPAHPGT